MKVIQVSSYYPPHLGGQENAVQDLAQQLAVAGHEVQVFASSKGGGSIGTVAEKDVQVRRMRSVEFGHAPIMPAIAPALIRAARDPKNTVVHVHIGQAFTPEMVWLLAKLRGFSYVAELHIDFEPSGPVGLLLPLYKQLILGRVLRSAAAVVVLNKKTLHTVRGRYGVHNARLISNGIAEPYFAIKRPPPHARPPKQLRLLFVGRLTKQKNVGMLLQALTLAKTAVQLDIVGDGEERAALERQAVLSFYKTCDALVMPSLYEAQPLVLLEAMAARIPIIGTNVIGVAEHIWGAGIVVKPSPEGMAEGFARLRSAYAQLPEMVEAGYKKVQKLRWQNLYKEYEKLYQQVLAE